MRIAIWMTGGMRSHWKERCWKSFKETLLDRFDCDLYICSSNAPGQESEIEKIKKVYPNANVSYVTEVSEIPNGPTVPTETYEDMIQNLSLYRVKEACKKMKESGKEYDIVIKTRPDLEYRGNFPDYVFEPSHICWIYQHPWKSKPNLEYYDAFAMGSPEIMDWYANFYDHIAGYCTSGDVSSGYSNRFSKFGIRLNTEHALFCHMEDYKVAHFILNKELEENHFHVKREGSDEGIDVLLSISSMGLIRDKDPDNPPNDWKEFVPFKDQWSPF